MNHGHRALKFFLFLFIAAFSVDSVAGIPSSPTFQVDIMFSDANPMPVDVSVVCTDVTVDQTTKSASHNNPAIFNLSNIGYNAECTATQAVPPGYSQFENCVGIPLANGSGYCSIFNEFIPITLDVQPQSDAYEPDRNGAFQLILGGNPPWGGLQVNIQTSGTATSGSDYARLGKTVTVPYGVTNYQIPVVVKDDLEKEDTETVTLILKPPRTCIECALETLSSPANYQLSGESEATIQIFDDEFIQVGIEAVGDAAEPGQEGSFRVYTDGPAPDGGLAINLTIGGSATRGVDYRGIPLQIRIPAEQTSLPLVVTPIDDKLVEGPEDVKVFLRVGQDYKVIPGESNAGINILDDDQQSLSITASNAAVSEPSGTGVFTLTLASPAESDVAVGFTLSGSATPGEDFVTPASPAVIAAGQTTVTIDIVVQDDQLVEGQETVTATMLPVAGIPVQGSSSAALTIDDDDVAGIQVKPISGLVTGEDGTSAEFTVVLLTQPSAPVTIPVSSSDTTEATVNPESLEFSPANWNVPKTVTVTGVTDVEEDGDVAFTIILGPAVSNDPNYAGVDPEDVSGINKNVSFGESEFTMQVYSVDESAGSASIGIRRTGNTSMSLTVLFETVDGSANTSATAGEDYASTSVQVSWPAGDATDRLVDIEVFENVDSVNDATETVELRLSSDTMDARTAVLEISSDVKQDIDDAIGGSGLPPNQAQIAKVIVTSCPQLNNTGGFQELCTALVVSATGGNPVEEALRQATPDDAVAVRSAGMQTSNVQVAAIDGRLGTIRGGGGAGFSASGFNMNYGEFSMSGSLLKSFLTAFNSYQPDFLQANASANDDPGFIDEFGRWGAWVSGRVVFGEKDPTTRQVAYDFDTAGITFGLDYRFSNQFVAGLAVGYANTDADIGKNNGVLDTSGYSVTLYGTWFQSDRFYFGGSLSYGSNNYDQLRKVRYQINRPAGTPADIPEAWFNVEESMTAKYDGNQLGFTIDGGWDFTKNGWTFGPTFHVNYVNVDVDAYDEQLIFSSSGFDTGWAVHINDQSYKSLQPSVGFQFSKAVSKSWGVFIPQGYIDVVSELKDNGAIVTGTFLGDANKIGFALETDSFEETFARAGLGFGLVLKNNKSAFLMVDGDFGRDLLKTYYINAGFRWQF